MQLHRVEDRGSSRKDRAEAAIERIGENKLQNGWNRGSYREETETVTERVKKRHL